MSSAFPNGLPASGTEELQMQSEQIMEPPRFQTDAKPSVCDSSETFRHTPLLKPETQIRLLELEPGSGNDDIICNLRVYDRDDLPSFDAISYTWGDERPIRSISVNGKLFDVRQNCWYALKQVRSDTSKRLLWIDTICINQNDTVEKGHQVQRIASTFKSAGNVLASLGNELSIDGDCAYLFHWAVRTVESSEMNHDKFPELFPEAWAAIKANHPDENWTLPPSRDSWAHKILSRHYWMQCLSLSGLERVIEAFNDLGRRRYWKRVWIHPELAIASNVLMYCSSNTLNLRALEELIQYLDFLKYELSFFNKLYPNASKLLRSLLHNSIDPIHLTLHRIDADNRSRRTDGFCGISFELLKELECSDPRDRVFAFLPLMRKEVPSLQVDYTKSRISLAFQLLNFCSTTLDIRWVLECLRLNQWDRGKDVGDFLQSRAKLQAQHVNSNESFRRGVCLKCDFPHGRVGRPDGSQICEVQSKPNGTLTLNYVPKNHINLRSNNSSSAFYSGASIAHLSKQHHVIRSPFADNMSGEVIALLPYKTRQGDILIRSRGSRYGLRYESLVLRKHETRHGVGIYEIIGQALVRPDFHLKGISLGIQLFLHDEDWMAFALEDFNNASIDPGIPQDRRIEVPFTTTRFSSFAIDVPGSVSSPLEDYCPWRLSTGCKCLAESLPAIDILALSDEENLRISHPVTVDMLTPAHLLKSKGIRF